MKAKNMVQSNKIFILVRIDVWLFGDLVFVFHVEQTQQNWLKFGAKPWLYLYKKIHEEAPSYRGIAYLKHGRYRKLLYNYLQIFQMLITKNFFTKNFQFDCVDWNIIYAIEFF